jgi:hypothetical protein
MAKPIRERGIRWAESYGDKSAYLKEQMDEQIGPGAYLRWEGHDNTTNTDYYVVVSPGFSKKKGYHFFAGLRKMPADHGASGKKFRTQREAMAYARQMWRVLPPQVKPVKPGGYMVQDIMGKAIVLEPQHGPKGASSGSGMSKLASVQHSLGRSGTLHESWSDYTMTDRLCWAHKASPVLGFMPALYSKARFMGTDVYGQGKNDAGYNEFTQKVEPMPLAPKVATYQEPNAQDFETIVNKKGVVVNNKLVDVKRRGGKLSYQYLPRFADKPEGDYKQATWRDMTITPKVIVPSSMLLGSKGLWSSLKSMTIEVKGKPVPAVTLPREIEEFLESGTLPKNVTARRRSEHDPVKVGIGVRPEAFTKAKSMIEQWRCLVEVKKADQKNLIDLVALQGDKFNWDDPYFESIKMKGSQLIIYSHGIPVQVAATEVRRTEDEAETGKKSSNSYVLKDPFALISSYASDNLEKLGLIVELDNFLRDPRPPGGRKSAQSSAYWDNKLARIAMIVNGIFEGSAKSPDEILGSVDELRPAVSEAMGLYLDGFKGAVASGHQLRQEDSAAKLMDGGARYSAARDEVENTWDRKNVMAKKAMLDKVHSEISPYLLGFKKLAENGIVKLTPDMFLDSRTCAPKMRDYHMETYDVGKFMLPMSGGKVNKNMTKSMERALQPYAPDFSVEAPTQPNGAKAARRWDVERNAEVFGPLPEGVSPVQGSSTGLKGMRSVIASGHAKMSLAKTDGGSHDINSGEVQEYRTKPGPNGPEFITGELHDIIVSPEQSSARSKDVKRNKAGVNKLGFVLMTENHAVKNADGVVSLRQYQPTPFTSADPKNDRHKEFFTAPDGTDLSQYAFMDGKNTMFTSTGAIKLLLERHLGVKDEDFGPFTELTVTDLRIIDDHARDGQRYYESIESYRKARQSNSPLLDANGVPIATQGHDEEVRSEAKLVRDGYENSKSIDQAKYEYGRICHECSGKKGVEDPAIFSAMIKEFQQAIENPDEAFKPKQIDVYGVMNPNNEDEPWMLDFDGNPLMFGTMSAAEEFLASRSDKDSFVVEKFVENANFPLSLHIEREKAYAMGKDPGQIAITRNHDMVSKHLIQETGAQLPGTPAQPQAPAPVPGPAPAPAPAPATAPATVPDPAQAVQDPAQTIPPTDPAHPGQPNKPKQKQQGIVSRLVALANKLDAMGRRDEANAVDRVIRTATSRGAL